MLVELGQAVAAENILDAVINDEQVSAGIEIAAEKRDHRVLDRVAELGRFWPNAAEGSLPAVDHLAAHIHEKSFGGPGGRRDESTEREAVTCLIRPVDRANHNPGRFGLRTLPDDWLPGGCLPFVDRFRGHK